MRTFPGDSPPRFEAGAVLEFAAGRALESQSLLKQAARGLSRFANGVKTTRLSPDPS